MLENLEKKLAAPLQITLQKTVKFYSWSVNQIMVRVSRVRLSKVKLVGSEGLWLVLT